MSETVTARFAVETRGTSRELGAFVVAARFDRTGRELAFALGDGTVRRVDPAAPGDWREAAVHDGAVLALAAHPLAGFVSGGG